MKPACIYKNTEYLINISLLFFGREDEFMATFLKYLVYILVIMFLFVVIKGWYSGSINEDSTIKEVVIQVDSDGRKMAEDVAKTVDSEMSKAR